MTARVGPLLALLVVLAIACSKRGAPADAGPTPRRVVSLSPSTTEAIFAVGKGSDLVGRSRYCDHPPEARALPEVGGYVDPSFEAILGLRPDLVVGARGPTGTSLTDRLEARGVRTYFPPTETFAEVERMIEGIGAELGAREGAARVIAEMKREVGEVEREARARPRLRVLLLFGLEPPVAAGQSTLADEMLARLGAVNVAEGKGYPVMSVENVLGLDPDVVVDGAMGAKKTPLTRETPGWGKVRAVREGHVAPLADDAALRPGPRLGAGLRALSRAIARASGEAGAP